MSDLIDREEAMRSIIQLADELYRKQLYNATYGTNLAHERIALLPAVECAACEHWQSIEPADVLGIGACCALEQFSADNRLTTQRDCGCSWFHRRIA